MLARQLAEDVPLVDLDTDALETAKVMAGHRLPGMVVAVDDRVPSDPHVDDVARLAPHVAELRHRQGMTVALSAGAGAGGVCGPA